MGTIETIKARYSCRDFTAKKVEKKHLEQIADSLRYLPSACNSRPWKFIIIDHAHASAEIKECFINRMTGTNKFVENVSSFFVIASNAGSEKSVRIGKMQDKDYASIDVGIAAQTICLAARQLGIDSCIMGYLKEKELKEILNIPQELRILLTVALGYARIAGRTTATINPEDIIFYNKY